MVAVNKVRDEYTLVAKTEGVDKTISDSKKLAGVNENIAKSEGVVAVATETTTQRRLSAKAAVERLQRSIDGEYRATRLLAQAEATLNRAYYQNEITLAQRTRLSALATRRHDEMAAAARRAANDNERAGASFGAVAGGLRANIAAVAAVIATIGGGALIEGIAKAGLQVDSLERGFAAAAGSAEQGARELVFIRDAADRLGLSLGDTSQAYLGFLAASRGTALQGAQTREIFLGVTTAMGALGKGSEETSRALIAVQQMMSKGKVSAEEMNGQLGEALPGALSLSAKAMGMTTQELVKFMGEGKLMANDLLPKLSKVLKDTYADAAAKASQGLQANLNRASTAWLDYRDTIARNGLNDALSRAAGDMAGFLNSNRDAAVSLGQGLGTVVDWLRSVGAAATDAYDSVKVILAMLGEADMATVSRTVSGADLVGGIGDLLAKALEFDQWYINKVIGVFAAGYELAVGAWNGLPVAFGQYGAAAANLLIAAVEFAVNKVVTGFNSVVDSINDLGANLPGVSAIGKAAEVSFGRVTAASDEAREKVGENMRAAAKAALDRDYLGEAGAAIGKRFTDLKDASRAAREERQRLAEQTKGDKLADALRNTGDGAAQAAQDLDKAGKAANAAAQEFETFKGTAEQAFKTPFPEDALRKQGQELQAQLDKFRDQLAKEDPRYVTAIEYKIKLNLEGRELEKLQDQTDELAKGMSHAFSGVFDDMFSNANKGLDGFLDDFTRGLTRMGTRAVGEAGGFNFTESDETETNP